MSSPVLGLIAINDVYTLANFPRLATLISHHRKNTRVDRWLIIVAGDFLAPSVLSSLDSGRHATACLNAMGFTHAILGNHEDDLPPQELAERIREFKGTFLGTNVRGFGVSLPSSDVVEVSGVRVGIAGVVMNDRGIYRRAPFGGATLLPPNECIVEEAGRLRAEGCATVIALTHQWIAGDRELAKLGVVPLIVGGHEHEPFLEHVGSTTVVKAGSDAVRASMAIIELGPAVSVRVWHESVASYSPDPNIAGLVEDAQQLVRRMAGAVLIPKLPTPLTSRGSRTSQVSMGTFVCTLFREALEADGAVFNGGGIRGTSLHEVQLTFGDVLQELPFANEVVVAPLPGQVLRDAIVFSRTRNPTGDPAFLQLDDAMVMSPDGQSLEQVGGKPFDARHVYRIAAPRAHLLGLDRIEPLERYFQENPHLVPAAGSGRGPQLILLEALAKRRLSQLGGFHALDANHDGKITATELASAMHESEASDATVRLLLDTLDVNHDGVLTEDEC